jgi:hypothetical protein
MANKVKGRAGKPVDPRLRHHVTEGRGFQLVAR